MRLLKLRFGDPGDQIRSLLNNNMIGTPGQSMVYQHQHVDSKIDNIDHPIFISVELGGSVVGVCCFVKRETYSLGEAAESFYIRYFSFKDAFRTSGKAISRIARRSRLKEEIESLFSTDILSEKSKVFYAYVDPGNLRSKRVIDSYHFQEIGRFQTVYFSRFFPKKHSHVIELKGELLSEYKKLAKQEYQDHLLYTDENLGYENGAYGIVENGQLVAALQANAERWKIFEIPGGKNLIKLVSKIPFINRLFNTNFEFLSLEGFVVKSGHENYLESLIETALVEKKRNTAITCLSKASKYYEIMKEMNQGFITRLSSEKEMAVVIRSEGVEVMRGELIYVSGFDNM